MGIKMNEYLECIPFSLTLDLIDTSASSLIRIIEECFSNKLGQVLLGLIKN